jgi:ribonuclease HI
VRLRGGGVRADAKLDVDEPEVAMQSEVVVMKAVDERCLRFMTWNVGLRTGKQLALALDFLLHTYAPDVLALQECFHSLHHAELIAVINHRKYQLSRIDQSSGIQNGGAALLTSSRLQCQQIPARKKPQPFLDEVWIKISPTTTETSFQLQVGSWYVRQLDAETKSTADDFEAILKGFPSRCVVLGDLNAQVSGTEGTIGSSSIAHSRGKRLTERANAGELLLVANDVPTHFSNNSNSCSVIDHVLLGTKTGDLLMPVHDCAEVINVPLLRSTSDHAPVMWDAIPTKGAMKQTSKKRRTQVDWSRATVEQKKAYNERLTEKFSQLSDIKPKMCDIADIALKAARGTCPTSKGGLQPLADPKKIQEKLKEGSTLSQEFDKLVHRSLPPHLLTSDMWHIAERLFGITSKPQCSSPLIHPVTGVAVWDPKQKNELFLQHVVNLHKHPAGYVRDPYIPDGVRMKPPVTAEVQASLKAAHSAKCLDSRLLRAEFFKEFDEKNLETLRQAMERVLCDDPEIPASWRNGITSGLPKPGRLLGPVTNLRPVTVTEILSRLTERVTDRRVRHKYPLARSQFGFVQNVSMSLSLLGLGLTLESNLGDKQHCRLDDVQYDEDAVKDDRDVRQRTTLLVCIDGKSAFCRGTADSVAQKIRDQCPDLAGEANWIHDFLSRRTIQVKYADIISDAVELQRGFPQGTILGPLAWAIYVNELVLELERLCSIADADDSEMQADLIRQRPAGVTPWKPKRPASCKHVDTVAVPLVVADDLNFIVSHHDPAHCIAKANSLLAAIARWSAENGVQLDKMQSGFLVGSQVWMSQQKRVLRCGDLPPLTPQKADGIKLLGVTFDAGCDFHLHVEKVVSKARAQLQYLMALRQVPAHIKIELVRACIMSQMLYAVETWWPFTTVESRKLLEQQHYACARFITNMMKSADSKATVAEAGLRSFAFYAEERIVAALETVLQYPPDDFGPGWVRKQADELPPKKCEEIFSVRSLRTLAPCVPPKWNDREDNRQRYEFSPTRQRPFSPQELGPADNIKILWQAPGGLSRNAPEADKKKANEAVMDAVRAQLGDDHYEIFSDGSVDHEPRLKSHQNLPKDNVKKKVHVGRQTKRDFAACGGGALVINYQGQEIHRDSVKTSTGSASYTPEFMTFKASVEAAETIAKPGVPIVFFADCQSELREFESGALHSRRSLAWEVWATLLRLATDRKVVLVFIFSHCGIKGNDLVDELAKQAAADSYKDWQKHITYPVFRRDAIRMRMWSVVQRHDANASKNIRFAFCRGPSALPRIHPYWQSILAQVRCGACPSIGGALCDDKNPKERCPLCNKPAFGREGATTLHLFQCQHKDAVSLRKDLNLKGPKSLRDPELQYALPLIRLFISARRKNTLENDKNVPPSLIAKLQQPLPDFELPQLQQEKTFTETA